ncbi:MAG: hypothetical protein ABJO30_03730, partial [Hyphomicrobiales bacterium]
MTIFSQFFVQNKITKTLSLLLLLGMVVVSFPIHSAVLVNAEAEVTTALISASATQEAEGRLADQRIREQRAE